MKLRAKVDLKTSKTIKNGAMNPNKTKKKPIKINHLGCIFFGLLAVKPAFRKMVCFHGFKLQGIFHIT